jgi:hypothetical protein
MSNALLASQILSVGIIIAVLLLFRRGRLREDHAIFWTALALSIFILSTWQALLIELNTVFQVSNATDLVLTAYIFILLCLGIYFSVTLSGLSAQNKIMAQNLALLAASIDEMKDQCNNQAREKGKNKT